MCACVCVKGIACVTGVCGIAVEVAVDVWVERDGHLISTVGLLCTVCPACLRGEGEVGGHSNEWSYLTACRH